MSKNNMSLLHKFRIHYNGEQSRMVARQELERFERIMKYDLRHDLRHDLLIHEAINSTSPGISNEKYCDEEIIVSLTTYGRRIIDVSATIESIMQGTMKPNRIVLCLEEELRGTVLPITLKNQMKRGLEVIYYKNIRSYKKLVPTIQKYPEASVITIDDDAIYDYDLVEKLVNTHISHPKHVVANRIHRVVLGEDNHPLDYPLWKWLSSPEDDSPLNFATGVGGMLYPPHVLHPEVTNEKVFMDICPHADDVWFYAMTLMAGSRVVKCPTRNPSGDEFVLNESVQDMGLCQINITHEANSTHTENDTQLKAVFDKYNLWGKLLEK